MIICIIKNEGNFEIIMKENASGHACNDVIGCTTNEKKAHQLIDEFVDNNNIEDVIEVIYR